MKRIISVFILICCLFSLSACNLSDLMGDNLNGVVLGEKYVYSDSVNNEYEQYFIVEKDRLIYHFRNDANNNNYTITYKYTILGVGMISYFYDSKEINDTKHDENSFVYKNGMLIISENVIYNESQMQFIRESYLKDELENFGKTVE